jgi:hypothetical protein
MVIETECKDETIPITGEPMGDLNYSVAVVLTMPDIPNELVLRAAKGEWIYKLVRMSISIDKPPVAMHLAIDSHPQLLAIRREYLYPTDFMPKFRVRNEGSYDTILTNYYHQIAVLALPGDRVFLHFYSKEPFRGQLKLLGY